MAFIYCSFQIYKRILSKYLPISYILLYVLIKLTKSSFIFTIEVRNNIELLPYLSMNEIAL